MNVILENEHFSEGAFRKAFKVDTDCKWVVKKYKTKTVDGIVQLNLTREQYARKQAHMHIVARNLTQCLDKIVPDDFGHTYKYGKVYFANLNGEPVTVEEFLEG